MILITRRPGPHFSPRSREQAQDYDYSIDDFDEFIEVVPSAITELSHWQQQGYSLITPTVLKKKHAIEEIR
jgi:hypothetical protein